MAAIPKTTGERPRTPAAIPAGAVTGDNPERAARVPVERGAKARLKAGQDVDAPGLDPAGDIKRFARPRR